jgi:hypothetical protein
LLWVAALSGILLIMAVYCYYRNVSWKIKLLTVRLNRIIRCPKRDRRTIKQLLKELYSILNRSIANDDFVTAYQITDLLKLAYGYGIMRRDETARLMAVIVSALNNGKSDVAGFIVDAYRPLIRQLLPEFVPSVAEQLTLIAAVSLKQKQNFLVAKVTECIFLIMEVKDTPSNKDILIAAIKAFKVIGVLGLRRRDVALFREVNTRLSSWFITNAKTGDGSEDLVNMLTAWLHRIVQMNGLVLFDQIEECTQSLIDAKLLSENAMELLFEEWGNLAASACLNPNSTLAGRIINFLFVTVKGNDCKNYWVKVISIAGRVAKLAVSRHGIPIAFVTLYPLLEEGRKLLWSELRFVQSADAYRQEILFRIVRECLIVIAFASRQELIGSSGQSIVEVYNCWVGNSTITTNPKSIKKYCQLLLFSWLKDKRQIKKHMPHGSELTEPILFSQGERYRFGI